MCYIRLQPSRWILTLYTKGGAIPRGSWRFNFRHRDRVFHDFISHWLANLYRQLAGLQSAVTKAGQDHHCFSLQRPPKRRHNCASGARMDAHLGWQSASKRWLSEHLFLASRFLAQWFLSVLPSIQLQQRNVMPNWPAVSVCGRRRKPWAAVSFDCGRCGSAERSKHARGIAHGSQVASKPFEHIPRAQSPSKFTLENYSECLMEVCCALEVRVHTV